MMKLSTFYFLTPDKNAVDRTGVTPDIVLPQPAGTDKSDLTEAYRSFAPMAEQVKPAVGAVGLNVFGAQQRLQMLGYDIEANGTMDEKTTAAVWNFQSTKGMYAYGVLDYSTMAQIEEACVRFLTDGGAAQDAQLAKALEILKN
jgi:carboxyl-terminal processing protease